MNSAVKDKSSAARPPKQRRSYITVSSSYGNYRIDVKMEAIGEELDRVISRASTAVDNALKKRQIKQIREVKVRDRLEAKRRKHKEYMQAWRKKAAKWFVYHNDDGTFHSDGGDYVFGKRIKEAKDQQES